MGKSGFRNLRVWQSAKELAVEIYKITEQGKIGKDFCFREQIRRAAVSIPSNIAEGEERDTDKDAVRFLYIAKGSLAELLTQLIIACDIGYLDIGKLQQLEEKCEGIGRMLGALIKAKVKDEG